jgi:hypothetical protein
MGHIQPLPPTPASYGAILTPPTMDHASAWALHLHEDGVGMTFLTLITDGRISVMQGRAAEILAREGFAVTGHWGRNTSGSRHCRLEDTRPCIHGPAPTGGSHEVTRCLRCGAFEYREI